MDFVLFSDHLLHDKEEDGLFIFIIVSFCIVSTTDIHQDNEIKDIQSSELKSQ